MVADFVFNCLLRTLTFFSIKLVDSFSSLNSIACSHSKMILTSHMKMKIDNICPQQPLTKERSMEIRSSLSNVFNLCWFSWRTYEGCWLQTSSKGNSLIFIMQIIKFNSSNNLANEFRLFQLKYYGYLQSSLKVIKALDEKFFSFWFWNL